MKGFSADKPPRAPVYSNRKLMMEVNRRTGVPVRDVRDCMKGILHVIKEAIGQGQEVNLHEFGAFYFRKRKGRTVTKTTFGSVSVQPDSIVIKFRPSQALRRQLAKLDPSQFPDNPKPSPGKAQREKAEKARK